MSCSSAICTVNTGKEAFKADDQIPFGRTLRRFGKFLSQTSEGVTLSGRGYYYVNCSITVRVGQDGPIGAQLYLDDTEIPGGFAKSFCQGESPVNIVLVTLIRLCDCDTDHLLTVRLLNDGIVDNMSTVITKV